MALPNDAAAMTPLIRDATAAALRPETPALQPNVGALLHDVARLIRRRFERRARQTGLPITRQQARALLLIARHEGLSQAVGSSVGSCCARRTRSPRGITAMRAVSTSSSQRFWLVR